MRLSFSLDVSWTYEAVFPDFLNAIPPFLTQCVKSWYLLWLPFMCTTQRFTISPPDGSDVNEQSFCLFENHWSSSSIALLLVAGVCEWKSLSLDCSWLHCCNMCGQSDTTVALLCHLLLLLTVYSCKFLVAIDTHNLEADRSDFVLSSLVNVYNQQQLRLHHAFWSWHYPNYHHQSRAHYPICHPLQTILSHLWWCCQANWLMLMGEDDLVQFFLADLLSHRCVMVFGVELISVMAIHTVPHSSPQRRLNALVAMLVGVAIPLWGHMSVISLVLVLVHFGPNLLVATPHAKYDHGCNLQ